MSRKFCINLIFAALAILPATAFASRDVGNGGDICEDRFIVIRDNIKWWIGNGGSAGLSLPGSVTLPQYNYQMATQLTKAHVSCTDDKVMIGEAEKTCKNFVSATGDSEILCNRKRFLETKEDDQFVLVHHEYAGLAGVEVNDGDESKYSISNQITSYIEVRITRQLVVKPTGALPSYGECVSRLAFHGKANFPKHWVAGPSFSLGKDGAEVYVDSYPKIQFHFNVHRWADGTLRLGVLFSPKNKAWEGYNSTGSGIISAGSYSEVLLESQHNVQSPAPKGTCRVHTIELVCAATQDFANRAIDNGIINIPGSQVDATGPYQPNLNQLPKNCGF
jgi:hypothetical protein